MQLFKGMEYAKLKLPFKSKLTSIFIVGTMLVVVALQLLSLPRAELAQSDPELLDAKNHWAEADINLLHVRGVVEAYPDGTYRPDEPISRAEVTKLIASAFDFPEVTALDDSPITFPKTFDDVRSGHWVQPYLHSIVQSGVIQGYPDGYFAPERAVSRAELAQLLFGFMGSKVEDQNQSETRFADEQKIPDWAEKAVKWAASSGILRGFPDGTFRPDESTTRAEAASLLRRAMELRGALFSLQGRVKAVSTEDKQILLELPGEQLVGFSISQAIAYRGSAQIDFSNLNPGEYVSVLMDEDGDVEWVQILGSAFTAVLEETDISRNQLIVRPILVDMPDEQLQESWKEANFKAASSDVDDLNLKSDQVLNWNRHTEFYRHGATAGPDDLQSGDRLFVSLYGNTPLVTSVDAVNFDSWGPVTQIDTDKNMIYWDTDNGTQSAEFTTGTRFIHQGKLVGPTSVRLDDLVGLVLEPDTNIVEYVESYSDASEIEAAQPSQPEQRLFREFDFHSSGRAGPAKKAILPRQKSILGQTTEQHRGHVTMMDMMELEPDFQSEQQVTNSQVIGATSFRNSFDVSGEQVTVAVVDTGIDPLLADRLGHTGGTELVDWMDFTGTGTIDRRAERSGVSYAEGDILTETAISPVDNRFTYDGKEFIIERSQPAADQMRVGWLRVADLLPEGLKDLVAEQKILVAAVQTESDGVYDAVYVDEKGDGKLSDLRKPWRVSSSPGLIEIEKSDKQLNISYAVTDVSRCGQLINLGYDTNGHGSQVASVISGVGGPDEIEGIAPEVNMMSLKALDSEGSGSWADVVEAVRYAAVNGADIINVSVTGLQDLSSGGSRESQILQEIAATYDVLIVTAVGNRGPGLATTFTPGNPKTTLAVGGASIPEIVLRDYGYNLEETIVWQHSSVGPRADGGLAANVVAPVSSPTAAPSWLAPQKFTFFEGTSCAAAHVSGAAALLLEAGRKHDFQISLQQIKTAIERGARRLRTFDIIEQGFGLLDVESSWEALTRGDLVEEENKVKIDSGVLVERPDVEHRPQGVYLRESAVEQVDLTIENRHEEARVYRVDPGSIPAQPEIEEFLLPANSKMSVPVYYDEQIEGSIVNEFITVESDYSKDRIQHTIIRPVSMDHEQPEIIRTGELSPGRSKRYFLDVPAGTSLLEALVEVPDPDQGRVSFQLVNPEGEPVYNSHRVGSGSYTRSGQPRTKDGTNIKKPQPGVWEVTVTSAASLSFYGLRSSEYVVSSSVLPETGVLFALSENRWHWSHPHQVPETIKLQAAVQGADDLDVYARGWVNDRHSVEIVPRTWFEPDFGQKFSMEFGVPANTGDVLVSLDGGDHQCAGEIKVYKTDDDWDEGAPVAAGEDFLQIEQPEQGRYRMECTSADCGGHYITIQAWPEGTHLEVPQRSIGEQENIYALSPVPKQQGNQWAMVGLRDSENNILTETWIRIDLASAEIVISPVLGAAADRRPVNIREVVGFEPAGGVILVDGRLSTVSEKGTVNIKDVFGDENTSCLEVYFNSGQGDWSIPTRMCLPSFSPSEMFKWNRGLGRHLAEGNLYNPIIFTRLKGFLSPR